MNALFCKKCGGAVLRRSGTFAAVVILATVLTPISAKAAQITHEDFDYGPSVSFSTNLIGGGTGWTSNWLQTGPSSFVTSGSNKSLDFNQLPGLVTDGSTHIWSESSKGNERDFPEVALPAETLYFTALVRDYSGGASTADLRATFWDGLGATGNMRANIGFTNGTLFADGSSDGYAPAGSDTLASAFATNTTYLLAMKRTGTAVFASLIYADGLASTLAAEPVWQVTDAVGTGVDFESIRLLTNGSGALAGGIRIDEIRIATDWASAVSGLPGVIPEPSSLILMGLGGLAMVARRRRALA